MMNLIVNKLYMFSSNEKKARAIEFKSGKNIITSSKIDGTKKGKSVILKGIYYSLGADCYFEDMWDVQNMTYILDFSVSGNKYYIYRFDRLFKVFSDNFVLLFSTVDRTDLAIFLSELYQFSVKLPSRDNEKLELTPPAYSYLLNYLDQDKMNGTQFDSFRYLAQYKNYKENVLYAHFGVFNDEYYELLKRIDTLNDRQRHLTENSMLIEKMIEKLEKDIGNVSYSTSMDNLKIEVEKTKHEYASIVNKMSETKKRLIELRNEEYELVQNIKELNISLDLTNKEMKNLNRHLCPTCNTEVENTLDIRVKKYSDIEDIFLLKNEIEGAILKIHKKIEHQETIYNQTLSLLSEYESRLNINSKEINDVLKHKGFIEVKDKLANDWKQLRDELSNVGDKLKEENKKKREYDELKKAVNSRYYELMLVDKQRFGLKEIDSEKFENIRNVFNAGGSNKPIATVIWYFNLLRVKYEFNPSAIKLPLVLDSPNNVELDDEKRIILFEYLFNNIDENTQLIISTLGFDRADYPNISFNNIIELDNTKYELLNRQEYDLYKDFVVQLSNIDAV